MPYVGVKMYPGRTEEQKRELCRAITEDVVRITKCDPKVVSVSIEDIAPEDWEEKVVAPFIKGKEKLLYSKPE